MRSLLLWLDAKLARRSASRALKQLKSREPGSLPPDLQQIPGYRIAAIEGLISRFHAAKTHANREAAFAPMALI
jgi:hypothetical protein